MTDPAGGPTAAIPMYPFPALRAAYETLWAHVAARVDGLPGTLSWPSDIAASWTDANVVVTQTCGWPLVTELLGRVEVLGAFCHQVPGAHSHRYRAALVATRPGAPGDYSDARAAVNGTGSLSGWISLLASVHGSRHADHERVLLTGSHEASLAALAAGRADVASIDAVSLAHLRRLRPELTEHLHVVGEGPLVPTLPLIVPAGTSPARRDRLRAAFATAVGEPAAAPACQELLITGFVALDASDYVAELSAIS